jgi:hypothetical protein
MRNIVLPKSIKTFLGTSMICELTGRLMEPKEEIYVFPRLKKVIVITIVSISTPLFIPLTFVPFIPKKEWDLYSKKKKGMYLLLNI